MPQETVAPTPQKKQRLSTNQMLHLMRLEMDQALRHGYPISCMVVGLDAFDDEETLTLRKTLMPAVFGQLKVVCFENDVRGLGVWTERFHLAVFPHVTPEKIQDLADGMLERAPALEHEDVPEQYPITLSIGISHNLHPGPMSFETLVEEAEQGMALAHSGGGNRVVQAREVETEIDRLKEELDQQIQEIREQQDSFFSSEDDKEENWGKNLTSKVLEMFEHEPDQSKGVLRLQREVIAVITTEIQAWRETSSVRGLLESQRQIDQLERRVAKLTESLGMTEAELKRVAQLKNIDLGISSIYRSVQGLSGDDGNAEQKKEMLKDIFEANLELQQSLAAKT